MKTAVCIGGPMHNMQFTSRFPKGFLVVNRPAGQVALYDYVENSDTFVVRVDLEAHDWRLPERVGADKNRYRAALEPNYDVIAYDAERMGDW